MTDFYYMRALHVSGQPRTLHTYGDQKGSVTRDPHEAYRVARRTFERAYHLEYGHIGHAGQLFAYWPLPHKMVWHEALPIAQTTPPERVCVLIHDFDWETVDLVLPPGQLIIIDQYEETLPKSARST